QLSVKDPARSAQWFRDNLEFVIDSQTAGKVTLHHDQCRLTLLSSTAAGIGKLILPVISREELNDLRDELTKHRIPIIASTESRVTFLDNEKNELTFTTSP